MSGEYSDETNKVVNKMASSSSSAHIYDGSSLPNPSQSGNASAQSNSGIGKDPQAYVEFSNAANKEDGHKLNNDGGDDSGKTLNKDESLSMPHNEDENPFLPQMDAQALIDYENQLKLLDYQNRRQWMEARGISKMTPRYLAEMLEEERSRLLEFQRMGSFIPPGILNSKKRVVKNLEQELKEMTKST